MKIRKATKKDVGKMFEIFRLNGSKYPKKLALQELNEMFSKSLLKPTYFVVEEKKEIVSFGGFIPSWIDNLVYNLFWINTHPDYKGRGAGKKLIEGLVKEISKIKKPRAKMITLSTKIPSFFKKIGLA